jgi:hypothetical protein
MDAPTQVRVTDIKMPFSSMVVFTIKWALAAIPAMLLLMVIGAVFWLVVAGVVVPIANEWTQPKDASIGTPEEQAAPTTPESRPPTSVRKRVEENPRMTDPRAGEEKKK